MTTALEITETQRQHTAVMSWCDANGLDARRIPADGGLRIVGDVIHFTLWNDDKSARSDWQTTPMVSPPSEHGLVTEAVKR